MGKNTYNDRAKRPPVFFEKLILVSVKLSIRCHIGSGMPYLCFVLLLQKVSHYLRQWLINGCEHLSVVGIRT